MDTERANEIKAYFYKTVVRMIETIGCDTTYNVELDKVAKRRIGRQFIGVYPADETPDLSKYDIAYAIVNTDKATDAGTHWLALIRINNTTYLYDSYGRPKGSLSPYFKNKNWKMTNPNKEQLKTLSSNICGQICIAYILTVKRYGEDVVKVI